MEANDERVHHFPTKIGKKLRQNSETQLAYPIILALSIPKPRTHLRPSEPRNASRRPPGLGDRSEGVPPVPIPNTAVKPLSPDGTACASVWESRKSPNSYRSQKANKKARPGIQHPGRAFCVWRWEPAPVDRIRQSNCILEEIAESC